MENSHKKMINLFTQFVDTLVEDELKTIKLDAIKQKNEIFTEINSLKEIVFEKIETVEKNSAEHLSKVTVAVEIFTTNMSKSFDKEHKISSEQFSTIRSEIESEVSILKSAIENLASKVGDAVEAQDEKFSTDISSL